MSGRLVVFGVALALAVAGCASERPADARERLRGAVERLEEAGGAAILVEATYHNQPSATRIVSTGLIDIAHRRYEVTTTLPRTGTVRRVYADGLAYEWRPVTGWTLTDVEAAVRGSSAFGLGHLASNPVLLLDLLRAAGEPSGTGGASAEADRESGGGESDTGEGLIHAEADLDRLHDADPVWSALAGQVRPASGARTVPVGVGTDGEGRANLLRVTLPLPRQGTAPRGRPEVDVTVRLSRFGAPTNITPPPPEKVRDITAQITHPSGD
ncbi:MAG: hypothetical protein GEV11_27240 [Streptosporangiales bacterium]|nr:hypothetical protein [Streptosporangiales bacterium]